MSKVKTAGSAVLVFLVVAGALLGAHALITRARTRSVPWPKPPIPSAAAGESATDRRIAQAEAMIQRAPADPKGYLYLTAAYQQKARETGDFGFNAQAEEALNRVNAVDPANYDALKLRAKLLLTYHRFSEARTLALQARDQRPDDHDVYGALTDANVELGDYDEAVKSAQRMVDLRPDTGAYARVSYLRSLHGDAKGAIDAMVTAAKAANPNDPEEQAWCRVQLANELINDGRRNEAEQQVDNALVLLPTYHLALSVKGRILAAKGDLAGARTFYQQSLERVPLPETAAALGDVEQKLGQTEDAQKHYQLVEFIESTSAARGTYSRQLAVFYADHDMKLDQALTIARQERATRQDIYTADALAWCLFKNGQFAEAQTAMREALRLKTRDPRLFYHAGMIAAASGQHTEAVNYLNQALKIESAFDPLQSDRARQTLAQLSNPSINRQVAQK